MEYGMEYEVWRTEYSVRPPYCAACRKCSRGLLSLQRTLPATKEKREKKKKERTVKQPKKRNVRESLLPVEGSLVRR